MASSTDNGPAGPVDPDGATYELELAELHLRLLVAMAAADDTISDDEADQLRAFVERSAPVHGRARLDALLGELLADTPDLQALLRDIVAQAHGTGLGEALVDDLALIAHADEDVDHREEALLRLVCGAFGIAPRSLHGSEGRAAGDVSAEELQRFVHALVSGT